ncbi:CD276 antigen homolog isoform X2 [Brienomyrus brachyistius]|uniref:CD276 antigen homolog isoform X2 n=1 Tax=Brienomyrus brachyistius TaxID=42636 RepID=UPI0020B2282F|nr:CD276 antigen homolog isoform X2 [Brienomyrus brachyistius]XP_048834966.1 CD276 antigen homolog isoform X2 [Brienomyrus brachyistius]
MAWVKWRWIQLIGCMILQVQGEDYIYNATVNVPVGENVMLTCSTSATYKEQDLRVFWQRENSQGTSPADVLMIFKMGEINDKFQKESYRGRVIVFPYELPRGNFSLLLTSVQIKDAGLYETIVIFNNDKKKQYCRIQLNVGAPFSKPQVTMQGCKESSWPSEIRCETWGGFPKPVIHWIVGNQTINSDQVKINSSTTNGSISVTSTLHLRTQEEIPVNCIVENPVLLTNESTTETIHHCAAPASSLHGLLVLVLVPILLIQAMLVYFFCFSQKKYACRSNQEQHPQGAQCSIEYCCTPWRAGITG